MSINVQGYQVFVLIGFLIIVFPAFFVKILISIVAANRNQNFDDTGRPINKDVEEFSNIWGVTEENLSKWPNSKQKWLMRLLGLVLVIASLLTHFVIFNN